MTYMQSCHRIHRWNLKRKPSFGMPPHGRAGRRLAARGWKFRPHSRRYERMRANYLTSAFPKFLESHGLRRMRFHDLRHSCASLLLANGVPLKHIQEWLGHSDFTTTANIYAHLDYKSKITSAQAMETGLALPEGGDFGSRWGSIDVGENG